MRVSLAAITSAAAGWLMVSAFLGCGDMPQPPARPRRSEPVSQPPKRDPSVLPAVIEINPDKLDEKKRAIYDKGYSQGQKIAAKAIQDRQAFDDILKERDMAIRVALQFSEGDEKDNDVLLACGRKAAAKELLSRSQPLPPLPKRQPAEKSAKKPAEKPAGKPAEKVAKPADK
jgi:hypothetical protein